MQGGWKDPDGTPACRGDAPGQVLSRWGQRPPPAHRAAGSRARFKPLPAALANHTGERPPVCGGRRGGPASEGGPEFGATEAHAGPALEGLKLAYTPSGPGSPSDSGAGEGKRRASTGTSLATWRSAPGKHTGKEGKLGFCLKFTKMEKGQTRKWHGQTARACEDWGGGPSSRFLSVVLGTSVRAHQHALLFRVTEHRF